MTKATNKYCQRLRCPVVIFPNRIPCEIRARGGGTSMLLLRFFFQRHLEGTANAENDSDEATRSQAPRNNQILRGVTTAKMGEGWSDGSLKCSKSAAGKC